MTKKLPGEFLNQSHFITYEKAIAFNAKKLSTESGLSLLFSTENVGASQSAEIAFQETRGVFNASVDADAKAI